MKDKYAVIWTRAGGSPVKMGDLLVTTAETRFSYSEEFLASGNPAGLSLLASPALYGEQPVVYPARDQIPLFPRLMSMLPGHGPHNIQRRIYTRILEKRPNPPAPGLETDWEILLLAGHNGIGHLDVFRDDRAAQAAYARHPESQLSPGTRHALWESVRHELRNEVDDVGAELLARLIGPTPSVGGMIPKLLVAIPDAPEWDGRFAPPGTPNMDDRPCTEVVLKIEPMEYRGVLTLEAFCLDLHHRLGFEVPRHWLRIIDGMTVLAVERFDRTPERRPVPLESLFSVFAVGDRYFQETADVDLAEVGHRITRLGQVCNLDVSATLHALYRRFLVAFFTGNGDLHLENLSLLGDPADVVLAPVYDPAPMRAWSRHNTRSAIPIVFDDRIGGLRENYIALGRAFDLSPNQAAAIIDETHAATRDYIDDIMALETVPIENRRFLAGVLREERPRMMTPAAPR